MTKTFYINFSVAIFMYLCDKYKMHKWYPTDLRERARVNEYANWQHFNLRATGSMLFRTKVNRNDLFSYHQLFFSL